MTDPDVTYTGTDDDPAPTPAAPTVLDRLGELDGAELSRAVAAGALLVARAGDLWEALTEISVANTARPAIEIVTDVALQAALAEGEGAP